MKCLECKWDDQYAPKSGKCCGECGLCMLCEQATLYEKSRKLFNSSKNPLSFMVSSNVSMQQVNKRGNKS